MAIWVNSGFPDTAPRFYRVFVRGSVGFVCFSFYFLFIFCLPFGCCLWESTVLLVPLFSDFSVSYLLLICWLTLFPDRLSEIIASWSNSSRSLKHPQLFSGFQRSSWCHRIAITMPSHYRWKSIQSVTLYLKLFKLDVTCLPGVLLLPDHSILTISLLSPFRKMNLSRWLFSRNEARTNLVCAITPSGH